MLLFKTILFFCCVVFLSSSWITSLLWRRDLLNTVKLWTMLCRATQDRWVMLKSFTKCGPLEKEMATHSNILAWRTPWAVWKGKKTWHWKMSWTGQNVSSMLLSMNREWLLIAPERMKWLGQSKSNTQLWMCLVIKVKYDVVKENIA